MFETPILLITFNRPWHTAQVLAQIKIQQPRYLFVFRDGPRKEVPGDLAKCNSIKELIKKEVNWDCELKTLYSKENMGCGFGPARAITWFFEHIEQGIILEDDCLPANSFFKFSQELLNYYYTDQSIFLISGMNQMIKWRTGRSSYFISNFGHTNGWATWKRAWAYFDHKMSGWDTINCKKRVMHSLKNIAYYRFFSTVYDFYCQYSKNDVWDYQWGYSRFVNGGKTIVPSVNLIKNIGFDSEGTHTSENNQIMANYPVFEINTLLKHPTTGIDKLYDWNIFERYASQQKRTFLKKVLLKASKILFAK